MPKHDGKSNTLASGKETPTLSPFLRCINYRMWESNIVLLNVYFILLVIFYVEHVVDYVNITHNKLKFGYLLT